MKVLYSSATEFCEAPPGMELAVGDIGGGADALRQRAGQGPRPGDGPAQVHGQRCARSCGSPAPRTCRACRRTTCRRSGPSSLCREKIEARGLDMKLVSAHYLLDEQKILFFFTAENRVDFRELVKDLVSVFKMRIELRQIGVRDEARVVGGMGICGRALCCNSITDKLRPVSIKMAKEQNLTLNSMKISGPCGRLLCCLSYEFDVYKEARQALPSMGTRVQFEGEEFRVTEMNVLARRVRFQSETGRVLDVGFESLSRNPADAGVGAASAHGRAGSGGTPSGERPPAAIKRAASQQPSRCSSPVNPSAFCPLRSRSSFAEHRRELALGQGEHVRPR